MKILTLLVVTLFTAGQAWAGVEYDLGHIIYTQGDNDGGKLTFYQNPDCSANTDLQFDNGKSRYRLASAELTDRTIYIKATPDFGYTVKEMTITAEESNGSGVAEAPSRHAPGVGQSVTVTPVNGKPGLYSFQMPANGNNVTVTAEFKEKTKKTVDYIGFSETGEVQNCEVEAYVLDGTELYLGKSDQEIWYVCNSAIDYRTQLRLYGDTHIILADGCEMSVTNTGTIAINAGNSVLIYGQSQGTGKLSVEVTPSDNHYAPSGIYASNTITINGGIIDVKAHAATATATGQTSFAIYAGAEVFINGGQVTATGGDGIKSSEGDIILNWTNASDFIKASSYSCANNGTSGKAVKTAAGKRFVAYNPVGENEAELDASYIVGNLTDTPVTLTANDIAGKTLRPIDGNLVQVDAAMGITANGYNRTFDITIDKALSTEKTTHYYIYKANDDVTLTTDKNYGQNGIEFATTPADAIEDAMAEPGNVVTAATFAMPAKDFTINGLTYYNTDVKYMDWDDTQKKLVEKKTNANTKVYILTGGGATYLDGGWYVTNNWNTDATDGTDAAYTGKVTFDDDAHLILADGAEMSITPSSGHGIQSGGDIAIYSQSIGTDMGLLTITTSLNFNAIYTYDNADGDVSITINGGNINTTTNGISLGIFASANNGTANVTINGGKVNTVNHTDLNGRGISAASFNSVADVTIRGGEVSISTYTDGICTRSNNGTANITISGGQVSCITEAEPGIKASTASTDFGTANINLSLTNGTDFIKATSYYAALESTGISASVKIPTGKALIIDGTETILGNTDADYIFGDGTSATLASIANQTLRPSKNFPVAAGQQYTALYQEQGDWKVTDNDVKMYVPTCNILQDEDGNYFMELQEVTGGGIPNGEPIIAGVESGSLPTNIPVVGTSKTEADNIENAYDKAEEAIEKDHKDNHTEPVLTFFATNTTEPMKDQIAKAVGTTPEIAAADYMVLGFKDNKLSPISINYDNISGSISVVVTIPKLNVVHMIRGTYHGKKANSNAPTRGIPFDFGEDETMGINSLTPTLSEGEGVWYTIDGRKISGKPAQKGMYINQGKKVIIR